MREQKAIIICSDIILVILCRVAHREIQIISVITMAPTVIKDTIIPKEDTMIVYPHEAMIKNPTGLTLKRIY